MSPPVAGPAMCPNRVDRVRTARNRPRLSRDVTSETRTVTLVWKTETPACAMNFEDDEGRVAVDEELPQRSGAAQTRPEHHQRLPAKPVAQVAGERTEHDARRGRDADHHRHEEGAVAHLEREQRARQLDAPEPNPHKKKTPKRGSPLIKRLRVQSSPFAGRSVSKSHQPGRTRLDQARPGSPRTTDLRRPRGSRQRSAARPGTRRGLPSTIARRAWASRHRPPPRRLPDDLVPPRLIQRQVDALPFVLAVDNEPRRGDAEVPTLAAHHDHAAGEPAERTGTRLPRAGARRRTAVPLVPFLRPFVARAPTAALPGAGVLPLVLRLGVEIEDRALETVVPAVGGSRHGPRLELDPRRVHAHDWSLLVPDAHRPAHAVDPARAQVRIMFSWCGPCLISTPPPHSGPGFSSSGMRIEYSQPA